MRRSALKDTGNWRRKRQNSCTKSVKPFAWTSLNFKWEEVETVGELSKVCSQIVLKCLYFVGNGRRDTPLVSEQNLLDQARNGQGVLILRTCILVLCRSQRCELARSQHVCMRPLVVDSFLHLSAVV